MNRKSRIFFIIILGVFIGLNIFSVIIQKNIEKIIYSKIPDNVATISLNSLDFLLEDKVDLLVDEYKNQPNSKDEINRVIK